MKMDFWEKTNYTDGVPETYTKQLREKKMCDFWVYMPFKERCTTDDMSTVSAGVP